MPPDDFRLEIHKYHDEHAYSHYAQLLPFEDGKFDVVIDSHAILKYYGGDVNEFAGPLLEMYRVLKRGGIIYCITSINESIVNAIIPAINNHQLVKAAGVQVDPLYDLFLSPHKKIRGVCVQKS